MPTHWKLAHASPLGHCAVVVQTTQVWVSRRQCGVGSEHCASLVHPVWSGTHRCVEASHVSPEGQVGHPPPAPP